PLWTSADAAAATGGTTPKAWEANGVSIDTRTLRSGDLFVALQAARDGHDFVAQALAKGAAAALVSRIPEGVAPDAPLLLVPDVLRALEDLGRAARARTKARVVGITGSVGKTSTKEMLRAILGGQGRVHAAEASYNNHWGVPLTLARMPAEADYAVIEIGMNHPGEIAPLARMAAPHAVMITTVAPAHLEAFESIEGIAHEKASIMEGLAPGGAAILNADLDTTPILLAKADAVQARPVLFGQSATAQYRLIDAHLAGDTVVARAACNGDALLFKVRSPGRHFALNALGALAVAEALGADLTLAACDLGQWLPPDGRGVQETILLDRVEETRFQLFDDAFNANPASLAAALDVLIATRPENGVGRVGQGRRIAILGDMLELGPTEGALHAAIARHPGLEAVDLIHCVGPRMRALYDALPRHQRGQWVETAADLRPMVRSLVDAGDIVLVKGSKGSKVSILVDALRNLGQGPAQDKGTE
ncbi:MAG: UDP-N-acetylmuramoyl-tripeptide--D-alanyl-D-alanine ligase, partial [Cypionkella sp.]|nr:UDP-N-acetylmuramoyl-tripeptide--D-alanyl-D-alanine ligase [Cypionkella sp.]